VRDADAGSIATYWIDQETRAVLARERSGRAPGPRMVFEPVR
jgi:hypothetical protein